MIAFILAAFAVGAAAGHAAGVRFAEHALREVVKHHRKDVT